MKKLLSSFFLIVLLTGCGNDIGAPGLGDPLAPNLGNGGYDVLSYYIVLDYDPDSNDLIGSTLIKASANQPLRTFNLDFQGLEVDSVDVNDGAASFTRDGHELTVTPAERIGKGKPFSVHVKYHGNPVPQRSQLIPYDVGWHRAEDGSVNVFNYADGAATWFPANDYPSDKATFHLDVTVPARWYVLGPGSLVNSSQQDDRSRFVYEMDVPMSTSSAVLHIDSYNVETLATINGVPIIAYFPDGIPEEMKQRFEFLPEAFQVLSEAFGPYPFESYSVVAADPSISICLDGGIANSEQTLTLHCPTPSKTGEKVLVHELAHQWFGNSVAHPNSEDTWMTEGPATYSEWLWTNRNGSLEGVDQWARVQESLYYPSYPIGQPPEGDRIGQQVYTGGALLLHALRLKIGDEVFFTTLRDYLARFKYSHATVDDFIAVAEEHSGEDLDEFFKFWLFEKDPQLPKK